MNVKNKRYINLVLWVIGLLVVSSLTGVLTKNNIEPWYVSLNRSTLTPPDYWFGIVWTILYIMIAISGWRIWQANNFTGLTSIKSLYIFQLILNFSWTPLFFNYHLTGAALICLLVIIILVSLVIIKAYRRLKAVSFLLMPYLAWLLFAGYLNLYIWLYN